MFKCLIDRRIAEVFALVLYRILKMASSFQIDPSVSDLTQMEFRDLLQPAFVFEKKNSNLYGNAGNGKTHLVQEIGLEACKQNKVVRFLDRQSNEPVFNVSLNSSHSLLVTVLTNYYD